MMDVCGRLFGEERGEDGRDGGMRCAIKYIATLSPLVLNIAQTI